MSLGEPLLTPAGGGGGGGRLNALQIHEDEPAVDGNKQILPQSNSQPYFDEQGSTIDARLHQLFLVVLFL
jgi:hypothetical protein